MKYSFTLLFSLWFMISPVFAQSLSSLQRSFLALGYEPGINYQSKFEAKVFEEWETQTQPNRLDLLLAIDPNITEDIASDAKDQIDRIYEELNAKGILEKPFKKQVAMIHKALKQKLFKEYREIASPMEAFQDRVYSNFSAVAILAIAFDHYEVPYQIWTDAFLAAIVADPFGNLGQPIEIEPISISAEINFLTQDQQMEYVGFLLGTGVVSKKKIIDQGHEDIFYKYYLPQEDIFFHEMVGMLFMQQGIQDRKLKAYKRSVEQLEKAFMFRPSYAIKYQLYQSRISVLGRPTYQNWGEVQDLISLYKLQPNERLRNVVKQTFAWMTKTFVYEKDSIAYYDQLFQALINETEDKALEKGLGYIYYQEKAQMAAKDNNFDEAFNWIAKVDTLPIPQDMQTRMTFYIGGKAIRTENCEEKIAFIKDMTQKYDFLADKNDLFSMLLNCRLELLRVYLEEDEEKSQEQFNLFNQMMKERENVVVDQNQAAITFSAATRYYLDQGKKDQAKQMLDLGLKYTNKYGPLLELEKELK